MSILTIILLYLLVIFSFIIFINFKWCIKTIRDIAKPSNEGGYIKFIQTIIIGVLILCFLGILIYYVEHPSKVDRIDILLTVIVGWFGLIIGAFFGEKTMENLSQKYELNVEKYKTHIEKKEILIKKHVDLANRMNQIMKKLRRE
tara:strand:- start:11398 stop:11832 length:435 start_codon:yes stop_codon:yes gene_type:complete